MASIKDIIFAEFFSNDYAVIVKSGAITIFKHKTFEDFWVVCPEGFALSQQHDMYDATVAAIAGDYPYAPKNTSLLILSDLDREQLTTDQIVELEKDPFFFKKYVLQHSDGLTLHLLKLLEEKGAKSVSDLIMLPESFNALNEEDGYGTYHLLYSIVHKLPFIPIKAEQKGLQPQDFMFSTTEEWAALEEIMAIAGDMQGVYDSLKSLIERDADEQH